MDETVLKKFIHDASVATYASGDQNIKKVESDNSTTIEFTNGDLHYHDNYFGGEPFGGREVVFYQNKPVWMMVYYGRVIGDQKADDVYTFLMEALRNSTVDKPYRGPDTYTSGEWMYTNEVIGDVTNFSGIETISHAGKVVFETRYIGGTVNKN